MYIKTNSIRFWKPSIFTIALICLIGTNSLLYAETDHDEKRQHYTKLVKSVSKGNAEYVNHFDGPGTLTGIIFKGRQKDSKYMIGWKPADTEVIIIGSAINAKGSDVTKKATKKFITDDGKKAVTLNGIKNQKQEKAAKKTPPQKTQEVRDFSDIDKLKTFDFITAANKENHQTIHIVVSPSCPSCRRLIYKLQMGMDETEFKSNVTVKIVPVTNGQSSYNKKKAANILQYGLEGLDKPISDAKPEYMQKIKNNVDMMVKMMGPVLKTPLLIHDGQILQSFKKFMRPAKSEKGTSA